MSVRVVIKGDGEYPSRFAIGDKVAWNGGKSRGKVVDIFGRVSTNKSSHVSIAFFYDILTPYEKVPEQSVRWSSIPEDLLSSDESEDVKPKFSLGEKVRIKGNKDVYEIENIKRWASVGGATYFYVLKNYPGKKLTHHIENTLERVL